MHLIPAALNGLVAAYAMMVAAAMQRGGGDAPMIYLLVCLAQLIVAVAAVNAIGWACAAFAHRAKQKPET